MSLAATIRNGCNRLIGENAMVTIDIILYWNGLCKRER